MTNYERTKTELDEKEQELKAKQIELDRLELDPDDYIEEFENSLDESGSIVAAGYDFYPSDILKNCNPIAYSKELLNYVNSIDMSETEPYKIIQHEIEDLESEIEDLESELMDDTPEEN